MKKLMLLVLVIASFALGVYAGRLPLADLFLGGRAPSSEINVPGESGQMEGGATAPQKTAEQSVVVPTAELSQSQRDLLSKFGIDANAITITPTMVACAEAKLGATRLAEIQAGATPTFAEGASLLTCYR